MCSWHRAGSDCQDVNTNMVIPLNHCSCHYALSLAEVLHKIGQLFGAKFFCSFHFFFPPQAWKEIFRPVSHVSFWGAMLRSCIHTEGFRVTGMLVSQKPLWSLWWHGLRQARCIPDKWIYEITVTDSADEQNDTSGVSSQADDHRTNISRCKFWN